MSISAKMGTYLDNSGVHYELLEHTHSYSSLSTAITANIPPCQIAKAVVLEDHEGRKMMAVLPASNKIRFSKLNEYFHRDFHLMKEESVYQLFQDCEEGAIPPLAQAYNMDVVYDDRLSSESDVYLEGGDHVYMVHLKGSEFSELMKGTKHMRFSHQAYH
ncbi:YbaK/EbsC family protein [Vibrio sp. Of7-15]|uniref:aminoacyl-tRNA deacylase n=1 Tax=Vibrio sp. Of7-15 TaxID=2724879 RepID=UPI001EF2C7B3|nr:YbaK/EbsC family protein [Vibrio sp. Of7-15]MCG7499437.1 YbaK/EbsC family protein [Vibrio sp. Of7-15]